VVNGPIWLSLSLERWASRAQTTLRRYARHFCAPTASSRAKDLLRSWLTPEQLKQFEATKSFVVVGCDTGKRYCIRYGAATNVFEIDEAGCTVVGWCFLPAGGLAPGDVMLAQKIALENEERAAIAVARQFPVNLPRHWPEARYRRV
jgi:hypothetical protein